MKSHYLSFIAILLSLILFAHVVSAADQISEKTEYRIGPEDVLDIQVLGQPELRRSIEVSQEGIISFPMIGKIKTSGLTPFALEKKIALLLSEEKYLVGAQVSVDIKRYGSQKVYLLGEVKKPGQYFLKGKTHILSILAEAGGLTDDAGTTVILIRENTKTKDNAVKNMKNTILPNKRKQPAGCQIKGNRKIITVDLDDITMGKFSEFSYAWPGDIIKVPTAPKFYVTGEVKHAGEFKWEKQLSVRRAIAMAGGPTKAGAVGRTTIQRFINGAEVELKPKMTDIIQSKDIVIVPQSYF